MNANLDSLLGKQRRAVALLLAVLRADSTALIKWQWMKMISASQINKPRQTCTPVLVSAIPACFDSNF